jgi:hypothetical protein
MQNAAVMARNKFTAASGYDVDTHIEKIASANTKFTSTVRTYNVHYVHVSI